MDVRLISFQFSDTVIAKALLQFQRGNELPPFTGKISLSNPPVVFSLAYLDVIVVIATICDVHTKKEVTA